MTWAVASPKADIFQRPFQLHCRNFFQEQAKLTPLEAEHLKLFVFKSNQSSNSEYPEQSPYLHSSQSSHGQRGRFNEMVSDSITRNAAVWFPENLLMPRGPFRSASFYKKRKKDIRNWRTLFGQIRNNLKVSNLRSKFKASLDVEGSPTPELHFAVYFVPKSKHVQVQEVPGVRGACHDFSLWESWLHSEVPRDFKANPL